MNQGGNPGQRRLRAGFDLDTRPLRNRRQQSHRAGKIAQANRRAYLEQCTAEMRERRVGGSEEERVRLRVVAAPITGAGQRHRYGSDAIWILKRPRRDKGPAEHAVGFVETPQINPGIPAQDREHDEG